MGVKLAIVLIAVYAVAGGSARRFAAGEKERIIQTN